jgi:hypothetical protein
MVRTRIDENYIQKFSLNYKILTGSYPLGDVSYA